VVNPAFPEVNMNSVPAPRAFATPEDPGIVAALAALVPQNTLPKTRRPGVATVDGAAIDLGRALACLPLAAVLEMAVSSC
jgi:hypothetical protein